MGVGCREGSSELASTSDAKRGAGENRAEHDSRVGFEETPATNQDSCGNESKDRGEAVRVQEWTDVAESDEAPMESITAKGTQPKGLIKTLVASGIQASASGGWVAQDLHQEAASALVARLAQKAVAENLHAAVSWLFLGQMDKIVMTDSKVRVAAEIVEGVIALVCIDKGLNFYCEQAANLKKGFICDKAKSGAGGPTKKAKTPKSEHHPHHNPKG